MEILAGLPAFALKQAAWDFLKGRAGNGRFMPKAPEVRELAEAKAHPFRKELEQILLVSYRVLPTIYFRPGGNSVPDGFIALRESLEKGGAWLRTKALDVLRAEAEEAGRVKLYLSSPASMRDKRKTEGAHDR